MTWREQLQPASLRGVPFEVDATTLSGGRSVQRHKFPLRDGVHVEDLGRDGRDFSFNAFVIGDDYIARRNALIGAIELGGVAVLIHPTFGRLEVKVGSFNVLESSADLGMAKISLSCIEHAGLVFPSSSVETSDAVNAAGEVARSQAGASFVEAFTITALPGYVAAAAELSLVTQTQRLRAELTGPVSKEIANVEALAATLDALDSEASALIATPSKLAARVSTALGLVGSLAVLRRLAAVAGFASAESSTVAGVQQELDNDEALGRLFVRFALVEAGNVSAATDYQTWDDAEAVKIDLGDKITATMTVAGDETFDALAGLRSAVVEDIDTRARDLRRLTTYAPESVRPALIIAHDLYGDAARDAELSDRNRIAHPGFVPVAALQVLSS